MALVLKDRVQETATANTTVSFTMAGAVTGFQSFASVGNTNTTYYAATDASGNWEVGIGTYSTTGPTLTRTTIQASSNSGSAVTFSGTVNVFVTYPSEDAVYGSGTTVVVPSGTILPVANGGTGVTTSTGSGSVVLNTAPTFVTSVNSSSSGFSAFATPSTLSFGTGAFTLTLGNTSSLGSSTQTNIANSAYTNFNTVNIANGVIASGAFNTVNIAASAASGSTTTVAIGSTAGTSTIALNGVTTLSTALAVSSGGIGTGTAGLTAFNNITGYTTAGTTGTTSTNLVFSTSPTLTTPVISGGTIDNAVIGGTTTAAGSFTTLNSSGNVSIANSTGNITSSIGNGVTATGNTNTIRLGINGASGSTTAITIGSTAGTSTTLLNGSLTVTPATAGTVTIGATAGTGTMTFASSTASQTTNLANGVTATGNTNTVSIGSAGASGSTTTIAIGSAAGTSTTTLNGTVTINAISNTSVLANNSGKTSVTAVTGSTTLATGGITLPTQSMASGSVWRVVAYGTYAAASSANARTLTMACYWGSTALTSITTGNVLSAVAQTTPWKVEFEISGSSTTAAWVTGFLSAQVTSATIPLNYAATAASTTGLTTASTLDFRVGQTGTATSADTINVQQVIIERIS